MAKKDTGFIATRKVPQNSAEQLIDFFQSFGDTLPSKESLLEKIKNETITVKEGILLGLYHKGISSSSIDDILITMRKSEPEKTAKQKSLKDQLNKYITQIDGWRKPRAREKGKTIQVWMAGITDLKKYYEQNTDQTLDSPMKNSFTDGFMVNTLFKGAPEASRPKATDIVGDVINAFSANTIDWDSAQSPEPDWIYKLSGIKDKLLASGITYQGSRDLTEGKYAAIGEATSPEVSFRTFITSMQTLTDQDVRNFMYMAHFIPTRIEKFLDLSYGKGKIIPYYDSERQMIVFQPDFSGKGVFVDGKKGYNNIKVSDSMAAFIENIAKSKGLKKGQNIFPDNIKNLILSQLSNQGDEGFIARTGSQEYAAWGRRSIKQDELKTFRAMTMAAYKTYFPDETEGRTILTGHTVTDTQGPKVAMERAYVAGADPNYSNYSARLMEKLEETFILEWERMYSDEIRQYEKETGKNLDLLTGHLPFLVNVNLGETGIYDQDFTLNLNRLPMNNIAGSMSGVSSLALHDQQGQLTQRIVNDLNISRESANNLTAKLRYIFSNKNISLEDAYNQIYKLSSEYTLDNPESAESFGNIFLNKVNTIETDIIESEERAISEKLKVPQEEVKPDEVSEVKPDEVSEVADEVPEKTKWRNPADIDHAGSLTPDTGEQGISKEISKWVYSALRNKNKLKSTIGPIVTAATAIGLSIYPKTRPLAGPLLKEAGLETGLQTIDPSIIGERPEGGIGPDFGVQLPQSLDMDEMENYLRAAQRFEVSGDPNLETSADRMYRQYAQNFRDQASIEARNDLATHRYTEEDFTTPALDRYNYAQSLPRSSEMPEVDSRNLQQDFGKQLFDKGAMDKTPLESLENYEEEMKQLFDLPT
jgi:hypothetical protein